MQKSPCAQIVHPRCDVYHKLQERLEGNKLEEEKQEVFFFSETNFIPGRIISTSREYFSCTDFC